MLYKKYVPAMRVYIFNAGFAASNISESYDAKIFSVATLLSSYLIYNSVKVSFYILENLGVDGCARFHIHVR